MDCGSFLYIPTNVLENPEIKDEELKLLAFLIADGSIVHRTIIFTEEEPVILDKFNACVRNLFPELYVINYIKYHYSVSTKKAVSKIPVWNG